MARRKAVNPFMIRCGEVRGTAVIVPYSVFGGNNYLKIVEGKGPAASTSHLKLGTAMKDTRQ